MLRKPSCVKAPGWTSSTRLWSRWSSFKEESPSKDSCNMKGRSKKKKKWGMELSKNCFRKLSPPSFEFCECIYLVKDVDFVVSQVEWDHAAQSSKSALLHLVNVAALQVEVGEVGCVSERPPGEFLQVVIPQVKFYRYLRVTEVRGDAQLKKGKSQITTISSVTVKAYNVFGKNVWRKIRIICTSQNGQNSNRMFREWHFSQVNTFIFW